jgi:hypothetical protein
MENEKDYLIQAVYNHPISVDGARKCLDTFGELATIGIPEDELIAEMYNAYHRRLRVAQMRKK